MTTFTIIAGDGRSLTFETETVAEAQAKFKDWRETLGHPDPAPRFTIEEGATWEKAHDVIRAVRMNQPIASAPFGSGTCSLTIPIVAGPTWDELVGVHRAATPIPSARWHGPPPKQRRGRR